MIEIQSTKKKAPWHLWAIGILALLWWALGSLEFIATVTRFEPYISQFPQEMLDYWYSFPWWMFAVWGIANFGGLVGAVLLLMKNKLAVPLFAASFACVVISMLVSIFEPGPEGEGGGVMALVIIAIAAALLVYVWRMRTRGVLR